MSRAVRKLAIDEKVLEALLAAVDEAITIDGIFEAGSSVPCERTGRCIADLSKARRRLDRAMRRAGDGS